MTNTEQTTKAPRVSFNIPFCGFYYSVIDQEIDNAVKQFFMRDNGCEFTEAEQAQYDREYDNFEFSDIRWDISKKYQSWFFSCFEWELANNRDRESIDIDFDNQFDTLNSPRYYNFMTDRLFVTIPADQYGELVRLFRNDPAVIASVREQLRPRDGFMPFYSNDLNDWAEDWGDWEEPQRSVFFEAICVAVMGEDWLHDAACEYLMDNGCEHVYSAVMDAYKGPLEDETTEEGAA